MSFILGPALPVLAVGGDDALTAGTGPGSGLGNDGDPGVAIGIAGLVARSGGVPVVGRVEGPGAGREGAPAVERGSDPGAGTGTKGQP